MRATFATVAAIIAALAAAAGQGPTLTITSPSADTVVSGPTKLSVAVAPPAAIRTVTFYLDGRIACTVERPPFSCMTDSGEVVRGHHVRVVAALADGSRLVDNVHTKDLGYTERTRVDAVLVPVIVKEGSRFIRGLGRDDFEVLEDGVPQRLEGLASEDSPLDLVLAIDISGSMEHALGDVKLAVKQLLLKLRPDDAATLIGFNDSMFLLAERERDQQTREEAVDLLSAWGGTALYDATVRAVDLVGRGPGRKGVIVFSDGDDRHSLTAPETAAAHIQSANAMLYTIGFGAGATVLALKDRLEQYARTTGGRAFFPRETTDLDSVFAAIVSELSNQYVLTYVSTNTRQDGAWRTIRVRVRTGKYEIRARRGYVATGTQRAGRVTP